MCGIAGFNLTPGDRIDALNLSRHLLGAIESRGRDASGAAWFEGGDDVWFDKAPIAGSSFAKRLCLSPTATNVILHTRFATEGDPANNVNNHPHVIPTDTDCITGVHNGVLRNHRSLFKALAENGKHVRPESECDSEAIFALLAHGGRKVRELLPMIEGDAAVAWIRTSRPGRLHLARLEGRPLAIGETKAGSVIFASTLPLLRSACARANVKLVDVWDIPAWTHLVFDDGIQTLIEKMPLPVAKVAPQRAAARPSVASSGKPVPAATRDAAKIASRGMKWVPKADRERNLRERALNQNQRPTPMWDLDPSHFAGKG